MLHANFYVCYNYNDIVFFECASHTCHVLERRILCQQQIMKKHIN